MIIVIKPHAKLRMEDRGVTEAQVREVLQSPVEVILAKYDRLAAYRKIEDRELVVVYEKKNGKIEVVTVLWVDKRRLKRLGFTRI